MAQQTSDPLVNPSAETIEFGPIGVRFLITSKNSGGSVAVFELVVRGKNGLPGPAHSHDHYEESIYGIEGAMTWTVDGNAVEIGPGQALCIGRGAVHRFDNRGDRDAKALCVVSPAEIGPEYFREVAAVLKAAAGGPPDRAKMGEIMRRYGLTPAAAPAPPAMGG
jgi:quercetin dioxygenase-like cupin family protein